MLLTKLSLVAGSQKKEERKMKGCVIFTVIFIFSILIVSYTSMCKEKLIAFDNFDRENSDTLGVGWTAKNGRWQIRDNTAYKCYENYWKVGTVYAQFDKYTLGTTTGYSDVVEVKHKRIANWGGIALHIQDDNKSYYAMRMVVEPHKEKIPGRIQIFRYPERKSLGWCFTKRPLKKNAWYLIIGRTDNNGNLCMELWNKEKVELLGRLIVKDENPLKGGKAGLYELNPIGGSRWDDFTIKVTDAKWWEMKKNKKEEITERRPKVKKVPSEEYQLRIASAMEKIRGEDYLGKVSDEVEFHVAKNEFESNQIILVSGKDLNSVDVELSDLKGPNGNILEKKNIKWNPIDYVYVHIPLYAEKGLYPDPLLPSEPIDIKKGEVQPFLITVYAPPEQKQGVYKGYLTIKPKNASSRKVKVLVRVYEVLIPQTRHVRTDFWFHAAYWEKFYDRKLTLEDWKKWLTFFKEYRNVPGWLQASFAVGHRLITISYDEKGKLQFDFSKFEKWLEAIVEAGGNCINVNLNCNKDVFEYLFPTKRERSYMGTLKKFTLEEQKEAMMQFYEAFIERLKERNWFKYAVWYAFDEAENDPERFALMKKWHTEMRKRFPELKLTFAGAKAKRGYDELIDIYCPLLSDYTPAIYQKPEIAAKETRWYVCASPSSPYPNLFIYQSGLDHRIIPWMMWKYNIKGFLYWGLNIWWWHVSNMENSPIKKRKWPSSPWILSQSQDYDAAGDGFLCYPGPDGEPFASIRLVNLRDGFEDYELFYVIDQMVKKNKHSVSEKLLKEAEQLLNIGPDLIKSTKEFTKKPENLIFYRKRLLEVGEKLNQES